MPLSMFNYGERVVVIRVSAKEDEKKHLEDLGFVQGAVVRVISNHNGDIIVEVKDSKLAVTKEMAMRIAVTKI